MVAFGQFLFAAIAYALPTRGQHWQYTEFVNHCDRAISFHQAHPGFDGPRMTLAPNGGSERIQMHQPKGEVKQGISSKFHYEGDNPLHGVFQHEYAVSRATKSPGVAWDGSLVDGGGPGINGPGPFESVNVKMTPIGNSDPHRYADCVPILCWEGETCHGVYLHSKDDSKTLTCSPDLEAFKVEFCVPDELMEE